MTSVANSFATFFVNVTKSLKMAWSEFVSLDGGAVAEVVLGALVFSLALALVLWLLSAN